MTISQTCGVTKIHMSILYLFTVNIICLIVFYFWKKPHCSGLASQFFKNPYMHMYTHTRTHARTHKHYEWCKTLKQCFLILCYKLYMPVLWATCMSFLSWVFIPVVLQQGHWTICSSLAGLHVLYMLQSISGCGSMCKQQCLWIFACVNIQNKGCVLAVWIMWYNKWVWLTTQQDCSIITIFMLQSSQYWKLVALVTWPNCSYTMQLITVNPFHYRCECPQFLWRDSRCWRSHDDHVLVWTDQLVL